MQFQAIERADGAFQGAVSAEQIVAMARRAFGSTTAVVAAVELAGGRYNTTFRVDIGGARPVILRVAPPPHRQARIERTFMRNEHAALPYFAPVAAMMPRTLFADWTHDVIDRDYVWQTWLTGNPAVLHLRDYPRDTWPTLYRQLGSLNRAVHDVRGTRFGPVQGPTFDTWRAAVLSLLADTVADVADTGLDADDLRRVLALADDPVLDQITRPRLLHGDLWVPNVMLAPDAPEPTIIGLFDHDRASWGDPAADWALFEAGRRPDRSAFWDTYGLPDTGDDAVRRTLIYRAIHLGESRMEGHRGGHHDLVERSYEQMRDVLSRL